jgi:hypothetical protein
MVNGRSYGVVGAMTPTGSGKPLAGEAEPPRCRHKPNN